MNLTMKLLEEVMRGCKEKYFAEDDMYILYFPALGRAQVKVKEEEDWIDSVGVFDARESYLRKKL